MKKNREKKKEKREELEDAGRESKEKFYNTERGLAACINTHYLHNYTEKALIGENS